MLGWGSRPTRQWHALIDWYGHHPQASGTLQLTGMANTTGQWHALVACCGQHRRRARFNELQQEAAQLKTLVTNNVLDSTKAFRLDFFNKEALAGLPPTASDTL